MMASTRSKIKLASISMDGNKEEALRCIHIAKVAIAAGDKQKALKFLGIARRLNKYLPVDNLFAACENLDSLSSSRQTNDAKNATKVKADKASVNGGCFSKGKKSCTNDHAQLVKDINTKKHYYAILGVERNCSVEDIKKAYKKLSLKVHPDKNKVLGAEEAFKKVSIAFKCLSDDESRKQYDQIGLGNECEQHNQQNPFEHDQQDLLRRRRRQTGDGYFSDDVDPEEYFRQLYGHREKFQKAHFFRPRRNYAPRRRRSRKDLYGGLPNALLWLPLLMINLFVIFMNTGPEFH